MPETNVIGKTSVGAVMTDITGREEMEESLRISNERYRYATRATFDAIWDWDIVHDHLYWGEGYEKIFGYKVSDKAVNHIDSFDNIHPDDRKAVFAGIDELLKGTGVNWAGEYRYKRKDGQYVYVLDRAIIIRNDAGAAVRMIGAMQDITERKLAEDAMKISEEKFNSLVNTMDGIVELKEKNTQLKELSRHLLDVREKERKTLAREVHDELGQLASAVKMDIDWLRIKMTGIEEGYKARLVHASATAGLLISTIRKLALELRPGMLDELGLNASLEWKCNDFASANSVPCIFTSNFDEGDMTMQMKTALFRICQEALINVMRHAGATQVTVDIRDRNGTLQLCVTDNGKGFDVNQKKSNTLGLLGMRERCASIDGTLIINSEQGRGTVVYAIVPKANITI
jgi:PAS domain S-box-containing protein